MQPPRRYNEGMKTLRIIEDQDPSNPRENDNLGTLACFHRRYTLGDVQPRINPRDYEASLPPESLVLPVYMYDHGGLALSTTPFSCQWDSGQLGIIHVSPQRIEEEYGADTPETRALAAQVLRAEIAEYHCYVAGEAYGYEVLDEAGNTLDSCFGFLGRDAIDNGLAHHLDDELLGLLPQACQAAGMSCDEQKLAELRAQIQARQLENTSPTPATPARQKRI